MFTGDGANAFAARMGVQRVDDDQMRITVGGFINTTMDNKEEIWA